jgi:predicted DNA-binding ribbon-helix-helix protein
MSEASEALDHPRYSAIKKRSVVVNGRRTSVSLEDQFWRTLRVMAHERRLDLSALIALIKEHRGRVGLSSAIRQFILYHQLGHKQQSVEASLRDDRSALSD